MRDNDKDAFKRLDVPTYNSNLESPSMENPQAKWRIEFARQTARRLVTFTGIKAIVIAGSVARDYADEYSDIEIPLFWDSLPTDEIRHAIVAALQADFLYAYDGPAWEDQLLVNGVQVDLWHITVKDQAALLEAVLHDHQRDLGSLNALDTIRASIPLYGGEIVQEWKRRAREYPPELAEKIIRERLDSFGSANLFILARRDNPTAFHAQLSFLQQEIFLVLLALNRRYFPTFKWLYRALESMQFKPENIDRRFRRAYEVPCVQALADMRSIQEETLRLVEAQFPQIDTGPVHKRLDYVRAVRARPPGMYK